MEQLTWLPSCSVCKIRGFKSGKFQWSLFSLQKMNDGRQLQQLTVNRNMAEDEKLKFHDFFTSNICIKIIFKTLINVNL